MKLIIFNLVIRLRFLHLLRQISLLIANIMALTQIIINISIVVRPTMYIKVFSKIINILKDKNISTHNSIPNIKLINAEIKITSLVNIYSCITVKNEYIINKKMDCTKTNIMEKYVVKTKNYTK